MITGYIEQEKIILKNRENLQFVLSRVYLDFLLYLKISKNPEQMYVKITKTSNCIVLKKVTVYVNSEKVVSCLFINESIEKIINLDKFNKDSNVKVFVETHTNFIYFFFKKIERCLSKKAYKKKNEN